MSDDDEHHVVRDQHYDESLDVADGEEVASVYTPVPSSRRPPAPDSHMGGGRPSFAREPPIHHPTQAESPGDDEQEEHDDTQEESDSEPPTSDMIDEQGNMGRKEYKSGSDPDAYDPKMYRDLPVTAEIKEIFKYIEKYQPQDIVLETKLKPFIPEYVPAIGDIDAFLKVPRPDGKTDTLGLGILDEPSSRQSDPHVLNLEMRYTSKQAISSSMPTSVRNVPNADRNPKAIEEWIHNINKLQKAKTDDTVQYRKPMPDVDQLMEEWPRQFEDLLRETSVPPADTDVDLGTYTDIACALLDIPVYDSRIQSLHSLFTLYLSFKNSEHFKAMMNVNEPAQRFGGNNIEPDQMTLD